MLDNFSFSLVLSLIYEAYLYVSVYLCVPVRVWQVKDVALFFDDFSIKS